MNILQKIKSLFSSELSAHDYSNFIPRNVYTFDGENTPYELGTPAEFETDYYTLRARSWEAFLKTDIVQNAIRKYCLWILGSGLKLQADPLTDSPLKDEFVNEVETKFRLYCGLKESTYNGMQSLHSYGVEILKSALLSGDGLIIQRYEYEKVSIEFIDGVNICNPLDDKAFKEANSKGNKIIDGVEIDKKGTHIAFYIAENDFKYKRVEAYGPKSHQLQAWLIYGLKYKTNSIRGMSLLTAVMETIAKLDRYKSATVGSAEENAKIPYTIEHNQFSDGSNPLINNLRQAAGKGKMTAPETESTAEGVATKIAQTTEKMVFNLPIGAALKSSNFKTDINFTDFYNTNLNIVYATLGIPPEVALDLFNTSYSASRAALKSWEYKMNVDRELTMKNQFYGPFYYFWLDTQVLSGKIQNAEYLEAYSRRDFMTLAAWRNCRFIGATVPHIDPVKEVTAERLKLGSQFDNVSLTTAEQSCENLNTGDYNTILTKTKKELSNVDQTTEQPDTL